MLNYDVLPGQLQESFDIAPDVLKFLTLIKDNMEYVKTSAVIEQMAQLFSVL